MVLFIELEYPYHLKINYAKGQQPYQHILHFFLSLQLIEIDAYTANRLKSMK